MWPSDDHDVQNLIFQFSNEELHAVAVREEPLRTPHANV